MGKIKLACAASFLLAFGLLATGILSLGAVGEDGEVVLRPSFHGRALVHYGKKAVAKTVETTMDAVFSAGPVHAAEK